MENQARLVVEGRANWVFTHPFRDADRVTIGRTADNDVELGDPHCSTHHAEIVRKEDGYILRDLDSRNGTLLNGHSVKEEKLHNGDTIQIGQSTMSFLYDGDESFSSIGPPPIGDTVGPEEALQPMIDRLEDLQSNLPGKKADEEVVALFSQTIEDLQGELQEARENIRRLTTVHDFTIAVGGEDSPLRMVSVALYFMARQAEAENGFIMQIDPKTRKWAVRARYGGISDWSAPEAGQEAQQVPLSISIVEKVVRGGNPVVSQSATQDPRFDQAKSVMALGIHSCLCFPMKKDGATVGVTYLDRRTSDHAFTKADEALFGALTNQLGEILYPAPSA
ncbi:FHA domain-containing protein [Candidatus Sumerlaeota bacterium]|nr:FHA domain-containing protein [Candidatus Sumerlaeota bacterium]